MRILLVVIGILTVISVILARGLREEFTWTRINYVHLQEQQRTTRQARYHKNSYVSSTVKFPGPTNGNSTGTKEDSTTSTSDQNADYIYENNVPMGANVWGNKLFITVPRRRVGVPSSLNYIDLNSSVRHNVPLIPYPNLEMNSLNSPNPIVSVYRVAVDPCDRLWFIDTGVIETLGNRTRIQQSQLIVIDLKTNEIIRRSTIDDSLLTPSTTLALITLDTTPETCSTGDIYAYMPDLAGYALIVYNFNEDRFWRVAHNYFYLEPLAGEFSIAGHNFQWNDGIFSIALSDLKTDKSRDAYFHSMAGTHMYRVSTRILRNHTLATRSYHSNDFEDVGDRGRLAQTSASALHQPTGVLFLGLVNQNALGCWNINTKLQDLSIVQKDNQKMIYPSDVKVSNNDVIVLTNTMPRFLYGRLDYDEINFRVWIENVDKAIEGTKCARR